MVGGATGYGRTKLAGIPGTMMGRLPLLFDGDGERDLCRSERCSGGGVFLFVGDAVLFDVLPVETLVAELVGVGGGEETAPASRLWKSV